MRGISSKETALLVVDVQQGFTTLCPRELPVPGGLEIVPNVNRLLALDWARIDASQDWHPPDHRSFLGQADNLYPPHCVHGHAGGRLRAGPCTPIAFTRSGGRATSAISRRTPSPPSIRACSRSIAPRS